jgi:predicted DNA-binding transcriptional regulator AlpA
MQTDTNPVKLLGRADIREPAPVSDMTLNRWLRDGKFPAPIMMIGRQRFWSAADIAAWQAGRRDWPLDPNAAARREQAKPLISALHRRHAAKKGHASPLVAA